MAKIDKLLDKFNKVKSAINSFKGIQAKINAINYKSAIDELDEKSTAAKELLEARRSSLATELGAGAIGASYSKKTPVVEGAQLVYPEYDRLENYLMFESRPRLWANKNTPKDHPVYQERSVALYIPDALISQAAVTYQADTIDGLSRALDEVISAIGQDDFFNTSGEQLNKITTKMIRKTQSKLTGGLSNLKYGYAVNPLQEQILNGVPLRSWDFTFDFWPKSRSEANTVNEIIYFFRSSMLPDAYSDIINLKNLVGMEQGAIIEQQMKEDNINASWFNYPNVFDISFVGPLGDKIDGFLPAFCATAQVDYTGGQKFATFDDGQPVKIQMTLNFLEIKAMTLGNYERYVSPLGDSRVKGDSGSIIDETSSTGKTEAERTGD
tara:strand:+ start:71 stop:1216 length:1146 start_codon:yes stop_codon:yes gene_type:complete